MSEQISTNQSVEFSSLPEEYNAEIELMFNPQQTQLSINPKINQNSRQTNDQKQNQTGILQSYEHEHQGSCCGNRSNIKPTKKTGFVMSYEKWNLWLCLSQDATLVVFILCWQTILTVYFYLVILTEQDSNIGYINIVFGFLLFYTYIMGVTTEPGVLPRNQKAIPEDSDIVINFEHPNNEEQSKLCAVQQDTKLDPAAFFRQRYCQTCYIIRPPKASHCNLCGNCVKGFDHHCNFFGNCVGERNLKYFFGWLCSLNLQAVPYFYVAFPKFYQQMQLSKVSMIFWGNLYLQLALFGTIFCCFQTCLCMRRSKQTPIYLILTIIFIIQCFYYYDFELDFNQNFVSTLLFLLGTIPFVAATIPLVVQYFCNISKGMTEKEKQVLRRMNKEDQEINQAGLSNIINLFFRKTPDSEIFR